MNRVTMAQAIELLRQKKVVAFPTETAYGLAADARSPDAIRRVKKLKGRDSRKPIALIAADITQVKKFFRLSKTETRLIKKHWPGSLTLVLTPKKLLSAKQLGAFRVGVRVPDAAVPRQLAAAVGAPITATSANKSGAPTCYTPHQVAKQLPTVAILNGGRLAKRQVSTVAEVRGKKILIHRPGPITPTI